jgi:hypothetical protein
MGVEELVNKINITNKNEMDLLKGIMTTQAKIIEELSDLAKRVTIIEKEILRMKGN